MTTLVQLREMVRERSDQQSSDFITGPELTGYINNSYGELYDILVSRFEDYFVLPPLAFSITTGNTFPIPATLYKLRGVDVSIDSKWATVYPFNFANRNKFNSTSRSILGRLGLNYRLVGNLLYLLPEDRAAGQYQLWYTPRFTPLVADADILSDVLDFEEYIIVDSAIKCVIKEESDPQALMLLKQGLKKRIEEMASNRDEGMPQKVADINSNQMYGGSFPYWGSF